MLRQVREVEIHHAYVCVAAAVTPVGRAVADDGSATVCQADSFRDCRWPYQPRLAEAVSHD